MEESGYKYSAAFMKMYARISTIVGNNEEERKRVRKETQIN